jgi:hypothetical protein
VGPSRIALTFASLLACAHCAPFVPGADAFACPGPAPCAPSTPIDVHASARPGSTEVTVDWKEGPRGGTPTSFAVERRQIASETSFDPLVSMLATTTYTDLTPAPNVVYAYRVISANAAGTSTPSAAVMAEVRTTTTSTTPQKPRPIFYAAHVPSTHQIVPGSSSLQPAMITIEAWVETADSLPTDNPAFVSYGLDGAPPWESYILQARMFDGLWPANFYFLTADLMPHQAYGQTMLSAGAPYFLAATYDGRVGLLYVNGNVDGSAQASGPIGYDGGGLGLGRKFSVTDAFTFDGMLSGVAIYDQPLTPQQILADYMEGPPP